MGLHVPATGDVELDHQPLLRRAGNLGISVVCWDGADSSHVPPFGQHFRDRHFVRLCRAEELFSNILGGLLNIIIICYV